MHIHTITEGATMAVRARFYVHSVTLLAGDTGQVVLHAAARGEENKQWAAYTPSGKLEMSLSRKAGPALDFFQGRIGREVYIDITEAD